MADTPTPHPPLDDQELAAIRVRALDAQPLGALESRHVLLQAAQSYRTDVPRLLALVDWLRQREQTLCSVLEVVASTNALNMSLADFYAYQAAVRTALADGRTRTQEQHG